MSIEVEINDMTATFVVEPEYGRRVVFEVRVRSVDVSRSRWSKRFADRYVVGLKGSKDEAGFAQFTSFEKAVRSGLWRARRYERAYSVPRGVPAQMRGAA